MENKPNEVFKGELPSVKKIDNYGVIQIPGNAGAGTSTPENQEIHPAELSTSTIAEDTLKNPVILRHLFQLCPPSLLATCRRVSKLWYNESLLTWRTSFPIQISMNYKEKDIFLVQRCPIGHDPSSMIRTPLQQFLEFIDKPENQCITKPYRNMALYSCLFSLNPVGFKLLWKAIGSNLTTLNLTHCRFVNLEEFRQIIYKFCPNLQTLRLEYCDLPFFTKNNSGAEDNDGVEYEEPAYGQHKHLKSLIICRGQLPILWVKLLSHFLSLTSLQIYFMNFAIAEYDRVIDAISILRKKDPNALTLKRFQFEPFSITPRDLISHPKFSLVKELRLPMRVCTLEVHLDMDKHCLRDALDYFGQSIDTMTVTQMGPEYDEGPPIGIPTWFRDFPFGLQLDNLSMLESRGDLLGSLRLLKYAPNLSTLIMRKPVEDLPHPATNMVRWTCKEELANVKMGRLKTFKLEFAVRDADIQHLVKWMPNITDLGMDVNDEQFVMVCQNWRSLTKLKLFQNDRLTAEGVTEMEKVMKAKETSRVGVRPNIANLKYLQVLSVSEHRFTLDAVYHLFLHLPTLLNFSGGWRSYERKELDKVYLQRDINANLLEEWLAEQNKRMLEKREENRSESGRSLNQLGAA